MGQHKIKKDSRDISIGRLIYRNTSEEDWCCDGCHRHFKAFPYNDYVRMKDVDDMNPEQSSYVEIPVKNHEPMRLCSLCAILTAADDRDAFRCFYPGQFEPHKITERMKAKARLFYSEWRDKGETYVHALSEIYPNMVYLKEEFDNEFIENYRKEMEVKVK